MVHTVVLLYTFQLEITFLSYLYCVISLGTWQLFYSNIAYLVLFEIISICSTVVGKIALFWLVLHVLYIFIQVIDFVLNKNWFGFFWFVGYWWYVIGFIKKNFFILNLIFLLFSIINYYWLLNFLIFPFIHFLYFFDVFISIHISFFFASI